MAGQGAARAASNAADDDAAEVSRLLALDVTPTSELAAVAARSGLRDAATRAVAWPKLLALDVSRADASAALFEGRATALNARERNQVELDVRRSHWIPASAGKEAREKLSAVIRGVLATHPGECRYYQGLHDIAAVLVLVCADHAPAVLDRLVLGHLRDNVRGGGLDAAMENLRLLPHLIAVADPELHAAVFPASTRSASLASARTPGDATRPADADATRLAPRGTASSAAGTVRAASVTASDDPYGTVDDDRDAFVVLTAADFSDMEHVGGCHFAVSWVLTWFAHALDNLNDVSRLFDVFLSSDPLAPLYVGAAAICADRAALLATARGEMDERGFLAAENDTRGMHRAEDWPLIEGMLHTRLSTLPALGGGAGRSAAKDDVVRVRIRIVEEAGEDGGFRARVETRVFVETVFMTTDRAHRADGRGSEDVHDASRETGLPPGWGVEAVLKAASELRTRVPPRSLFAALGYEPDPFSAFAAYPYPWLAFGRGEARGEAVGRSDSDRPAVSGAAARGGPFGPGDGGSATALFAQRLGANIRRAARRGVSELKKMETSDAARGIRGFLGGISLTGVRGNQDDAVPRLND
jgi:hypothetical protein